MTPPNAPLPDRRLRTVRRIIRLLPRGRNIAIHRWVRHIVTWSEVTCKTSYGFKMAVNLQEQLARDIFFNGVYEPVTAAVINHLLQPGDVFFDIGANQGFFSLLGAKRVGTQGAVYSFEPNTSVRRLLEQSTAVNGFTNVHPQEHACMEKAGIFALLLGGEAENAHGSAKTLDCTREQGELTVSGVSLDGFVAENDIRRIDLVKMDIEGGEARALAGMQEILKQRLVKNLIVEFHPELGLPGGRAGMMRLAAEIEAAGYTRKQLHEFPPGLFSHYRCRFSNELLYAPRENGSMREVATPQYLFQRIA